MNILRNNIVSQIIDMQEFADDKAKEMTMGIFPIIDLEDKTIDWTQLIEKREAYEEKCSIFIKELLLEWETNKNEK